MKTLERCLMLGLWGVLSVGCGARSDGREVGSGGNTNWLSACKTQSECGDGICASGACTPSCERNSDCTNLDENAACGASVNVAASANACDQGAEERVCAPTCDDDDECEDIGSGYRCQSGICVPGSCVVETPYGPCANKACGETCQICEPLDEDCEETEEVKYCDAEGGCSGTLTACGDEPDAETCASRPVESCEDAPWCQLVVGSPVAECRLQSLKGIACLDRDDATQNTEACAISQLDGLCYVGIMEGAEHLAEVVACDDPRCFYTADGCNPEECFSPSQHADEAYLGTREPCACNDVGSACVDGAALICIDGKWAAVEDGPCYPMDVECEGRLDDVTRCIELFDICRQEADGTFCGFGDRAYDCRFGQVVSSSTGCLQDDAYCFEMDGGGWCTGSDVTTCPSGYSPTDDDCAVRHGYESSVHCFQYTSTLRCLLTEVLTPNECTAMGAEALSWAPELVSRGCPDGLEVVAWLDWGAEGGLCCRQAADTDGGLPE
jgi:hypothetical protein